MNKKLFSFILSVPLAALALHGQTTDSLVYTGAVQTWTVPCGVTSVFIQCYGAQGGNGATGGNSSTGGIGGFGSKSSGTLAVTPGDVLSIYVGGAGGTPTAGFNGGASGGSINAGGGGGATDVRLNSTLVSARVIVAGGGGGGGRGGCEPANVNGGNGGTGGGNGTDGTVSPNGGGGFGAVGSAAGAAGIGCGGYLGLAGLAATGEIGGTGGDGQSCCCFGAPSVPGGGGGGGGFVGGGGGGGGSAGTTSCSGNDKGGGGGGAGGSNYTGGVTSGVVVNSARSGNGVVKITYNSIPAPGPISGPATMCVGTTGTFSISTVPGALSYTWTVPAGLSINSGQGTTSINVTANNATGGNITVTETNVCGTSPATIFTVTLNALPTVTATASSSSICNGSSVTLTGSGASTYFWSPISATGAVQTVTPTVTTLYNVIGTDVNGCINSATVSVTVNPLPVVALGSDITQCGGTVTLDAGNAGSTYAWSDLSTNQTLVVSASGTYSVTVTNSNACSNSDAISITINPNPVVTSNVSASPICAGTPTTLTANGADTYLWMPGSIGGSPVTVSPLSTTTYTVTGTITATGCSSTSTVTVTVNPLPIVDLGLDTTRCGGFVVLNAANIGSTYLWNDASTFQTLTAYTSGTYSVTVVDANGCSNSDAISVTINPDPTINITGSPMSFCIGGSTLMAVYGADTYFWMPGSMTGNTVTVSPVVTTTYTVTGTITSSGCTGSNTITITVNPLPNVSGSVSDNSVCVDDAAVVLTGSPAGGTWSGIGVTGSNFNPSTAGVGTQTVSYSYSDVNGCIDTANFSIVVSACVGINEGNILASGVSLFPNPTNGIFTLHVNANVGDMIIEVVDVDGRLVFSSNEKNVQPGFTKNISLVGLPNGVYLVNLNSANEHATHSVTLTK